MTPSVFKAIVVGCVILCSGASVRAAATPPPPGAGTGRALVENMATAVWDFRGYTAQPEGDGLRVFSTDTNPTIEYGEPLATPLLLRVRIVGAEKNHAVRIIANGERVLEFSRQFTALLVGPDINAPLARVPDQTWMAATISPVDFAVWVALDGRRVVVWVEQTKVADVEWPAAWGPSVKLGVNSGWRSNWLLKDFRVWALTGLPVSGR